MNFQFRKQVYIKLDGVSMEGAVPAQSFVLPKIVGY